MALEPREFDLRFSHAVFVSQKKKDRPLSIFPTVLQVFKYVTVESLLEQRPGRN